MKDPIKSYSHPLQQFKDEISSMIHAWQGMTKAEAHAKGICINCKQTPVLRSDLEKSEYQISGLCGPCFDKITKQEPE